MINEQRLHSLIDAFYKGILTAEEEAELHVWFHSTSKDQPPYPDQEQLVQSRMFVRLMDDSGYVSKLRAKRVRSIRKWYAVAASIVLFLTVGTAYYLQLKNADKEVLSQATVMESKNDIKPGKNTAHLVLEDGSIVPLDTAFGEINIDDVIHYADGSPINTLGLDNALVSSSILKIKTPKAGQYRVKLSDGTVVWLNAATELSYPKEFAKDRREVELDGEAYFEVAHNADKPFIVRGSKQTVKVLGTKFNMANYSDRSFARTTLLDGSIEIQAGRDQKLLRPGQEATTSNQTISIKQVYAEDAIAWKNGRFLFDNEPLVDVMAQISDWYDIQVEFRSPKLRAEKIFAVVSRYENISVVLGKIEATGVARFIIESNKIQVLPFADK